MMSEQPYALVFNGDLAPGELRAGVQARLAKLYGKPVGELDSLFTGGGARIIKRADSAAQLSKLLALFTEAGAIVVIQRDGESAPTPPPATGNAPAPGRAREAVSRRGPRDDDNEDAPRRTGRFTLDQFVEASRQRDRGHGLFELEDARLLEVNLDGRIWMKMGAMVAYRGDVTYTRETLLEKGFSKLLKRTVSGEGAQLTKAEGDGVVYLADSGKKITILELEDDAIFVNGNDVLALQWDIDWDVRMMKRMSSMLAGGLFNVHLSGTGLIAITTHYDPLTLEVTPGNPVFTDPNATVAWSASLNPEIRTDISLKTFFGRGSGESIQLQFKGSGFVVVQPYEEIYFQRGR
jgi:uncharacterized protein (AIM24 family)